MEGVGSVIDCSRSARLADNGWWSARPARQPFPRCAMHRPYGGRTPMLVLAVVLTVLLLLETLPSAIAGLTRARVGLTRLDQLTRLGLLEGRNLPVATTLGGVHLAGSAAVIAGLWVPVVGVAGGGVEAVVFGWVLSRQLAHGDRGRALGAYLLFTAMALAVLITDALR